MEKLKNLDPRQVMNGAIILAGAIGLVFGKKYYNGSVCGIKKDLNGQVIIVTGANTGIGKETAKHLAYLNGNVVLACRSLVKGEQAIAEIKEEVPNARMTLMQLDVSSLESIKHFADEFKKKFSRLDILIHNAGIALGDTKFESVDGFELSFATNALGPMFMNFLFADLLKRSKPARIVYVSSGFYTSGTVMWNDLQHNNHKWSGQQAYNNTKLIANMALKHYSKLVKDDGIKIVSLRPGMVRTEVLRYKVNSLPKKVALMLMYPLYYFISKNAKQGSQTTLHCALEDFDELQTGSFYAECKVEADNQKLLNGSDNERIFNIINELVKSKGY